MAKRARVRSRLNTNTSNASSRVENVKDSLLTIGFGQKLVENDAGVSRASSEMSEQVSFISFEVYILLLVSKNLKFIVENGFWR